MKIRIEPYKLWSGGAKALGVRAGVLRATHRQVRKHGDFDIIVNWGRNERRFNGRYLNDPEQVKLATNKLTACEVFSENEVPQPDWTTDPAVAEGWLQDGHMVVARKLLRANSGRGIVLVDPDGDEPLPKAPLYTKYIPKSDEYRVHVWGGKVIDVQIKRRCLEVPDEDVNWQIRNNRNGFIFARSDVELPACVGDAATRAVSALGLDFGAVDIGYNAKRDKARVYEVNTAPGLEGTTLEKYYEAMAAEFPQLSGGAYARRRRAMRSAA